ncbi:MAG: adenylate/guanylate cyclase domain-containing protein [Geminicoccaceae bacterium]
MSSDVSTAEAAILVVDDNDDNRYTLTRRLRRQGFNQLTEAASGREALEQVARRPFDLVLLDVMMPGMNGYEVLEHLKADAKLRHIPVIMISALSELDSVVRCIELGAEDYLPKPFNAVLLNARIGASLERKRLHDRELAHLAEIDRQRRRADELLHAMLPLPAVDELKASNRIEPRRFDDVAVLFADVVGFTHYCDRNPPEMVVANLDHLASTFEDITATCGMEKIKTVGDAFMATANLLDRHADPVMASLRAAFALAEAARSTPAGWQVRSGIHIGPVVAGVVGSRKFSFDLWGDTVNVAQRLSSLGNEPAVHLSATAWARVAERASGSALGELDVKGKGNVEVVRCLSLDP